MQRSEAEGKTGEEKSKGKPPTSLQTLSLALVGYLPYQACGVDRQAHGLDRRRQRERPRLTLADIIVNLAERRQERFVRMGELAVPPTVLVRRLSDNEHKTLRQLTSAPGRGINVAT